MAPKILAKNVSARLIKRRRVGLGFLVGFVFSLTYLSPSIYHYFQLPDVNSSRINGAPNTSPASNDHVMSSLSLVNKVEGNQKVDEPINVDWSQMNGDAKASTNPKTTSTIELAQIKVLATWDHSEKNTENSISYGQKSEELHDDDGTEPKVSKNYVSTTSITINSTLQQVTSNQDHSGDNEDVAKQTDTKITCDTSYQRSDRCDMAGDIRIHGKSGSMTFISSSITETRQIKPFARKADLAAMGNVREMFVRPSNGRDGPPRCAVNHTVPAVVFSSGGFAGNFFHDFSDVLVPLFQTSVQFAGEVQFLISDVRSWWVEKYDPVFKQLSHYQLIDLDADDRVHCFARARVGLDSDDDMRIDASRSTNGYSMVDFGRMLRSAFSLPRAAPVALSAKGSSKKPRLLVLARGRTRRFTNLDEIVRAAVRTGYHVEIAEPNHNVSGFARLVNSCDVMMGVHGAGLTNFVFLPTSAVVIQIVPWGNLEWIASTYYDKPPRAMGLNYLEYRICPEESTLTELYPRDDPVFTDPTSLHQRGWETLKEIYLVKQNVKLDVRRFRPVLAKALTLLRHKNK